METRNERFFCDGLPFPAQEDKKTASAVADAVVVAVVAVVVVVAEAAEVGGCSRKGVGWR